MISTTVGALVEAAPALERLGARALAPRVAFRVAKLLAQVKVELAAYETARQALIRQYGTERPATELERPAHGETVVEVPAAERVAFVAAVTELLGVTVGLDFVAVPLSGLGAAELTARDLEALLPFVVEDVDEGA